MSPESNDRQSARAIVVRAQTLATPQAPDAADGDADVLAALAGGSLSLAEADDETLERLAQRFGTDAIVGAILAAPDEPRFGNLPAGPRELPGRDAPVAAPVAPPAPAPVASQPARRTSFWSGRQTWMAAAASFAVVAVTASLLIDGPWRGEQSPRSTEPTGQAGGQTPRIQTPAGPQGGPGPVVQPLNRVAVLIRGDDREAAAQVESLLLASLVRQRALRPLDAAGLSLLRRNDAAVQAANGGDFTALASIGQGRGVALLVVGELDARAVIAENGTFAGVAELRLRTYRASGQKSDAGQTFAAPHGGGEPFLAPTESQARGRAAENTAIQAATALTGAPDRIGP